MKMTVYFDGAFWSALIEFTDSKKRYKAFRYVFGQEPKDDDILNFIDVSLGKWLRRYDKVEVSSEFSAPAISQKNEIQNECNVISIRQSVSLWCQRKLSLLCRKCVRKSRKLKSLSKK